MMPLETDGYRCSIEGTHFLRNSCVAHVQVRYSERSPAALSSTASVSSHNRAM
jgi:hypothetical protein